LSAKGTAKHAILLVAHGSRADVANREVFEMADRMSKDFDEGPVVPCFLEIGKPDIRDGFRQAVESGCKRVTAVPFFLATGSHVGKHIPEILCECNGEHPDVKVAITRAIGPDPDLDLIALKRVREHNLSVKNTSWEKAR
jgi:sirohydrochlorin cobaltochelatase